jgi:outer membrane protein assembly factor BamB
MVTTGSLEDSTMAEGATPTPLRLWPGILAAALLLAVRFLLPFGWPDLTVVGVLGSVVCSVAIMVWWTFFSRATRIERWGGLTLTIVALFATSTLAHMSMSTGAMGMLVPILGLPLVAVAIVVGAQASRRLAEAPRRLAMGAAIVLACTPLLLVRTDGLTSTILGSDFHWRWTPTAEERLLAEAPALPMTPTTAAATVASPVTASSPAPADEAPIDPATSLAARAPAADPTPRVRIEWPGFRGPARDSIVRGVALETDWTKSPPVAIWRRPVGPGWSSFAVSGDFFYTQEQRGEEEIVACYRVSTGEPIWTHRDRVRFWESNGGAGPRATPTLESGRLYAFGATGILNALDATSGAVIWSRNVSADSNIPVPDWGFSSSPLLTGDLVIVAAAGKLVAYERSTGAPRWSSPDAGAGYSSPHLLTIGGVPQVLLLTGRGATSFAPSDGARLWELTIPASSMAATIVQPALTADGDVLVADGEASRMRRVAAVHGPEGWRVEERWSSNGLKPYFNDFVVHKGHAYGFDGTILSAIDVTDGGRKWKGGRYGNGQLVLLADQDLLLVISEDGELALVSATPEGYNEVAARVPAIEGKTWNHPVLAGDVLLVRNGEEMAAFRLALRRH